MTDAQGNRRAQSVVPGRRFGFFQIVGSGVQTFQLKAAGLIRGDLGYRTARRGYIGIGDSTCIKFTGSL